MTTKNKQFKIPDFYPGFFYAQEKATHFNKKRL